MLDLRQLRYFVAVAEDEHVGRAAERLHISQSPLSRQIAQLEERLELQLFERSQQRIRLTADGRTFLAEARALLTHANRLESLARRLGRGDEGGAEQPAGRAIRPPANAGGDIGPRKLAGVGRAQA